MKNSENQAESGAEGAEVHASCAPTTREQEVAAEAAVFRARRVLDDAEMALRIARLARLNEEAAALVERSLHLSARELGEVIADFAREHGHDCARAKSAETTATWKNFRFLLSELVHRAEERPYG